MLFMVSLKDDSPGCFSKVRRAEAVGGTAPPGSTPIFIGGKVLRGLRGATS
jgi:hypothetical protein